MDENDLTDEQVAAMWDEASPHAIFAGCPLCGAKMAPEHAHYRCSECGFRDSCCD